MRHSPATGGGDEDYEDEFEGQYEGEDDGAVAGPSGAAGGGEGGGGAGGATKGRQNQKLCEGRGWREEREQLRGRAALRLHTAGGTREAG